MLYWVDLLLIPGPGLIDFGRRGSLAKPDHCAQDPGSGNATGRFVELANVWHSERWSLMALEQVDAYLEKHRNDFEAQLKELIRIPSVSAQPDHDPDTQRAAAFVRDDLAAMGLKAELIPTKRHPLGLCGMAGSPG